ncbi:MAG: ferritin [Chlorobi bacterium]|nr:ferritin [Chlorobiota bacterium]
MITEKVENILNRQVNREAYSSLLYLSMASWAETHGYPGVAGWLYAQAEEEKDHMLRFVHYINDRGGKAGIEGIEQPPREFEGIKPLFEQVLKHEQFITRSINEIVTVCIEEQDHTTNNWVQWFVSEQIEEESNVQEILDRLNLVGEHNLYMFDRDILSLRGPGSSESGSE